MMTEPFPEALTRTESDLIGRRELAQESQYGIHTLRALENFPSKGLRVADVPEFARAFGMVKLAAVRANIACGVLDLELGAAIEQACRELAGGQPQLCEQLVVPVLQGGAGTSTNMNVNEVLANRALLILGHPAGSYSVCSPSDHVNRSQASDDVYPTALRVALTLRNRDLVQPALETLTESLRAAAQRFSGVTKLARTHLQDAVPMTVDEEIDAWADALEHSVQDVSDATSGLAEVNIGGTAVGTALASPDGYKQRVVGYLVEVSGLDIRAAKRSVSATTDPTALLAVSASMRSCAITLCKVANDLRLLSSGPRAGLAEYRLPSMQAGSSTTPSTVNPVIPEFVNQIALRVKGLDAVVAMALDAAQLQLNTMLPAVAEALFESQELLATAATVFASRCIDGLDLDEQTMGRYAVNGWAELTKLPQVAGYSATPRRSSTGLGSPSRAVTAG
jgi:aspartate ammonia-lyase